MYKDSYIPKLNIIRVLFYLGASVFSLSTFVALIVIIITKVERLNHGTIIVLPLPIFLFSYLGIHTLLELIGALKIVIFKEAAIHIYLPLKFKKVILHKNEIVGYTISEDYREEAIFIYTKQNRLIEFKKLNYWGYKNLQKLIKKRFKYLGREAIMHKDALWLKRCYGYGYNIKVLKPEEINYRPL